MEKECCLIFDSRQIMWQYVHIWYAISNIDQHFANLLETVIFLKESIFTREYQMR